MSALVWQDPPRAMGSHSVRHDEIAAALRANPGRWALVLERVAISNAGNISAGKIKAYAPAGSFQGTVRKRPDGDRYDVYARYVGEVTR